MGLFVLLVAGEFLADVVAEVVFEIGCAVRAVGRDLLAKRHEVAAGDDLTEAIDQNPRAAKLVGDRPFRGWVRFGRCGRVLGGKFPGRVNKDRHLGQNPAHVAVLLDAFALAIVKILADQLIARPANLRLLVVAIKDKAPPRIGRVRDQIAVLVKGIALPGCKAVRVRIDRRVREIRLRDLRRTDEFVVAQPIAITVIGKPLLPRPRPVLRFLRILTICLPAQASIRLPRRGVLSLCRILSWRCCENWR